MDLNLKEKTITIRSLQIKDILSLKRLYVSLSDEERRFFHPFPFQSWKAALIISFFYISPLIRKFMQRILPKAVFLPLIAIDAAVGTPAGFGYLRLKKYCSNNKVASTLGILIADKYRNRGLGTQLMHNLVHLASQNNVNQIFLTVLCENQKAIRLYQKCGFNINRLTEELWKGKSYPAYEMTLSIPASPEEKKSNTLRVGLLVFPLMNTDVECGQTFIGELADVLAPLSQEIFIITGNLLFTNAKSNVCIINTKASIIRTYKEPIISKVLRFISAQFTLSLKLLRLSRKIDIIILFTLVGPLFLPTIIAKLLRKKVIVIVAGSNSQMLRSQYSSIAGWLFSKIVGLTEYLNYTLADRIAVESEGTINFLKLNKYRKKISIAGAVYIDTDNFKIKKNLKDRRNLIGYTGRLSAEKGVLNFVKAIPLILKERGDLEFLICGDGPLFDEIKKELKNNGSYNKVELTGWISHDELPKYLNELKLIVAPSYTEGGVPTVIMEAMACGTVSLVTPVAGVDVIKDDESGFILEDNSPECIAENVIRVLEHPNLDEIVNNACNLVEEEFSYETQVRRYRDMLYGLRYNKE